MAKAKIAICYDFDKTLSTMNMQEFDFMEMAGVNKDIFWEECNIFAKKNQADGILSMMKHMVDACNKNEIHNQKQYFFKLGQTVKLYDGVLTWFDRINNYAKKLGIEVKHYIVSSGIKDIIAGTPIAKYFDKIYASSFVYDKSGKVLWPALAINFKNKTQFLYRINKGTLDVYDETINDIMDQESRPVPFTNMIYIGDGVGDLPSMRLVKKSGGYTIGVYGSAYSRNYLTELLQNDKINYVLKADYSYRSDMEKLVKNILETIKLNSNLKNISKIQKNKIDKS